MEQSPKNPFLIAADNSEIELDKPIIVIGRMAGCDIQLDDDNISRRHAQIEITSDNETLLRDLNSSNGTWVNGQRIQQPTVLRDNDRLRFADVNFAYRSAEGIEQLASSATVSLPLSAMDQVASDATMTWQAGTLLTLVRSDGVEYGLNRAMILGRGQENDISLPKDRGLSQKHASFELTEAGVVVKDLGSRNGTWVNGKRISMPTLIKHGDTVRAGDTIFRLRVGNQPLAPLKTAETKSRGCMGLGIALSVMVAVVGIGAIGIGLLVVVAVIFYPQYFSSAPTAVPTWTAAPTWTPVPTWTPQPTLDHDVVIPGAEATEKAMAEKRALRALVWIIVPMGNPDTTEDYSTGSGSLVSPDGYILTNFHVVGDTDTGKLLNKEGWVGIGINWENPANEPDTFYRAEVVDADKDYDLALVHIYALGDDSELPQEQQFPYIPIGNSDELEIGAPLAVLGFPSLGGQTPTFTRGSVSGFLYDENIDMDRGWIKTDAEVNPGNSGGMAINERGELIGVPTQVYFGTQVVGKISEIRPINLAKRFLDQVP